MLQWHESLIRTAALRPKGTVNHMNTTTTRRAVELGKECSNKTVSILNRMKNALRNDSQADIGRLRQAFEGEVHAVYSECNRKLFLATVEFTEKFSQSTHDLSAADVNVINQQTKKQEDDFWNIVESMVSNFAGTRTFNVDKLKKDGIGKFQEVDSQARVKAVAQSGAFSSLGIMQLHLLIDLKKGPANTPLFVPAGQGIEARITSLKPIEIPEKLLVIWITERDSRVCPICSPLDGQTFDIDESPPQPVDDTHPGCRCRLLPVDPGSNKVFNG